MATNSIRVKSETAYTIEVNDAGETITFDLTDTALASKLFRMFDRVDKITKKYTEQAKTVEGQPDEALFSGEVENPDTGNKEERVLMTKNQLAGAELTDAFYRESREALDTFLGAGACQKIFGDANYLAMFDDLFTQLQPHFKKMGINTAQIRHRAAEKHRPAAGRVVMK